MQAKASGRPLHDTADRTEFLKMQRNTKTAHILHVLNIHIKRGRRSERGNVSVRKREYRKRVWKIVRSSRMRRSETERE